MPENAQGGNCWGKKMLLWEVVVFPFLSHYFEVFFLASEGRVRLPAKILRGQIGAKVASISPGG